MNRRNFLRTTTTASAFAVLTPKLIANDINTFQNSTDIDPDVVKSIKKRIKPISTNEHIQRKQLAEANPEIILLSSEHFRFRKSILRSFKTFALMQKLFLWMAKCLVGMEAEC